MKTPHWAVLYLLGCARERKLTLRELERRAKLGQNTITRWHTQCRTPGLDELERAFRVMDLRLGVMTVFPL